MSTGKEQAQSRLANLKAIEPMLSAMRVLSLSNMQMALKRLGALSKYNDRFTRLAAQLPILTPALQSASMSKKNEQERLADKDTKQPARRLLLVLGSSRGICGQYNTRLADLAEKERAEDTSSDLVPFGNRLQRALTQRKQPFSPREAISKGSLPHFASLGAELTEWRNDFEQGHWHSVCVLSFRRKGSGADFQAEISPLFPMQVVHQELVADHSWPAPIIEGDPLLMRAKIDEHLRALYFYQLLLEAVAAENIFRYRLLEDARENTEELLEELNQSIQIERRKEITRQLQETLAGSGLLAGR